MNRVQIENIYKANGLTDYKLHNTDDLLKCHGIDFRSVKGYDALGDLQKEQYQRFIINFLNGLGLASRAKVVPTGVAYVEDYDFLGKEDPEDDYFTVTGGIVYALDKGGNRSVYREYHFDGYENIDSFRDETPEIYLRFEYTHGLDEDGEPNEEWLHIIKNGEQWY